VAGLRVLAGRLGMLQGLGFWQGCRAGFSVSWLDHEHLQHAQINMQLAIQCWAVVRYGVVSLGSAVRLLLFCVPVRRTE
jgi:hypothetical protein